MTTTGLGPRWRHVARVLRAETATTRGARRALNDLLDYTGAALASAGYDVGQLSPEAAGWTRTVEANIVPPLETLFTSAFKAASRGVTNPGPYAVRHLEAVTNRLAGIPDEIFDLMRGELALGREAQESIPELAARVDGLLRDGDRWKNRAMLIARTEVIGANNAGGFDASRQTARVLGVDESQVVCEWLATSDGRTRETHADADGQQVLGIDTYFNVGGYELAYPGDPGGPPEEVCNCRCTALYHMPGDAGYPEGLTASATLTAVPRQETQMAEQPPEADAPDDEMLGVIIAALPAPGDPVHGIGPEEKHATLLFFGTPDENAGLTDEARTLLAEACATAAIDFAPSEAPVTGVENLGDDGAVVWMLDPASFGDLRAALLAQPGIQDLLDGVEQYPEFMPHVTVGYPAEDAEVLTDELLDAAKAVTEITFDRLAVWWGTSRSEFPLGGEAPEEEPMDSTDTEQIEAGANILLTARQAGITSDPLAAQRQVLALIDAGLTRAQIEAALTEPVRPLSTLEYAVPPPGDAPAGGPEAAQDIPADGPAFYGIIWPEGVQSGDARAIDTAASVWRDLPLPLMAQDAQAPGHDGAVRVGRIDTLVRDDSTYTVPVIRYAGVWDTSEAAIETARQVDKRIVRGISVDGDAMTVELRGSDGQPLDPMTDEFPEDGVVVEVAAEVRIAGGTVCSIPAFHQAYIANGTLADRTDPEPGWNEDGTPKDNLIGEPAEQEVPEVPVDVEGEEVPVAASAAPAWTLTASAGLGLVAEARYFSNPGLTEPTPLTVDDDGRVYGHLATWGTCHIGIDGICQEPPVSMSNYAYYAKGVVHTDDGKRPRVGGLTMGTGHAPMNANARVAAEHYDNTGSRVADIAIGQDGLGIWFSGKVCPGTTPEQVYQMRAAGAVSGDWREVVRYSGDLELVAALVVNVPGFAIHAPAVAASGDRAVALVASGVVHPTGTQAARGEVLTVPVGPESTRVITDAVEASLALRTRARAVQARVRGQRAATARRRLAALQARENHQRVAAAAARLRKV